MQRKCSINIWMIGKRNWHHKLINFYDLWLNPGQLFLFHSQPLFCNTTFCGLLTTMTKSFTLYYMHAWKRNLCISNEKLSHSQPLFLKKIDSFYNTTTFSMGSGGEQEMFTLNVLHARWNITFPFLLSILWNESQCLFLHVIFTWITTFW